MMNRMVAEHMTFVYNALHDIGACLAVFHGDEEQSLYAFFIQRIDDPCRISVFVSEVEGKIYLVRIRCYKCRAVLTVSVLKHGCAGRAVIRIDIDAGTEAVLGVIEASSSALVYFVPINSTPPEITPAPEWSVVVSSGAVVCVSPDVSVVSVAAGDDVESAVGSLTVCAGVDSVVASFPESILDTLHDERMSAESTSAESLSLIFI